MKPIYFLLPCSIAIVSAHLLSADTQNFVTVNNKEFSQIFGGDLPLHTAAKNGNLKAIEEIVSNPQRFRKFNVLDEKGRNALHIAAYYSQPQAIRALLASEYAESFFAKNSEGKNALLLAVETGKYKSVEALMHSKYAPNLFDYETADLIFTFLEQYPNAKMAPFFNDYTTDNNVDDKHAITGNNEDVFDFYSNAVYSKNDQEITKLNNTLLPSDFRTASGSLSSVLTMAVDGPHLPSVHALLSSRYTHHFIDVNNDFSLQLAEKLSQKEMIELITRAQSLEKAIRLGTTNTNIETIVASHVDKTVRFNFKDKGKAKSILNKLGNLNIVGVVDECDATSITLTLTPLFKASESSMSFLKLCSLIRDNSVNAAERPERSPQVYEQTNSALEGPSISGTPKNSGLIRSKPSKASTHKSTTNNDNKTIKPSVREIRAATKKANQQPQRAPSKPINGSTKLSFEERSEQQRLAREQEKEEARKQNWRNLTGHDYLEEKLVPVVKDIMYAQQQEFLPIPAPAIAPTHIDFDREFLLATVTHSLAQIKSILDEAPIAKGAPETKNVFYQVFTPVLVLTDGLARFVDKIIAVESETNCYGITRKHKEFFAELRNVFLKDVAFADHDDDDFIYDFIKLVKTMHANFALTLETIHTLNQNPSATHSSSIDFDSIKNSKPAIKLLGETKFELASRYMNIFWQETDHTSMKARALVAMAGIVLKNATHNCPDAQSIRVLRNTLAHPNLSPTEIETKLNQTLGMLATDHAKTQLGAFFKKNGVKQKVAIETMTSN